LELFELAALVAFAAVSVWVLGLDLWQAVVHDRHWTGTDGLFLTDQMQYLAWIQDASRHGLASDLFVLHRTPTDYFQPLVAISGAIAALGVAPWLVLLLWKPVAVVSAFFVTRAFARRSLSGRWERRSALLLGLFFGSWGVLGDLWLPLWSWGYPFGLIAIAALGGAILLYDRARTENRLAWGAPLLGALSSSLHPWQGETLILIILGAELATRRRGGPDRRRTLALPVATVVATAIPLLYLALLGRVDLWWRLARDASHHSFPLASILVALAPLLAASAFSYWGWPRSFLATATRAWPLAALVVYAVSATSLSATPLHAFAGITLPLGVLGVQGVQRLGWGRVPGRLALGALAVVAATIPASVYEMSVASRYMAPAVGNANFVSTDMGRALGYLRSDREPGGVLTRAYLGVIVPGITGRNTYVGGCQWSQPNCAGRVTGAAKLFEGALTPPAARAFVLGTTARFVLSGCGWRDDVPATLAPITRSLHRFGCATVIVVR
jgi:MFS family permease